MSYDQYLTCDPNDIQVVPPTANSSNSSEAINDNMLLKQMTRAVFNEFMRQEYKTTLHDTIFMPAIHHFILLLRPWLIVLCSIFVLLLLVGVVQLVLLVTRTEIVARDYNLSATAAKEKTSEALTI